MEDKKKQEMEQKMNEQLDKKINAILEQGIQAGNVDFLYKMVDIKKDMAEINKEEHEMMYRGRNSYYGNYDEYDNYGRGRRRDSRGRYMEGEHEMYNRRYRGHDYIDDMAEHYGTYMENKETGRYGSPEMGKALDYMLKSVEEFMTMLKNDASSHEEVEKIKRTARKISEM